MSGIAGIYYPGVAKPVDPARVANMTAALAHRGPDGSGLWMAPGVGLGHRRLSTIDVEGGVQPMATPEEDVVVAFDGEIYNFRSVRGDLEARGARFLTGSDAEVLLHGWRIWGPSMLDRLEGAFAIALYDADLKSLFLARDRFGMKPLHYTQLSDGAVAFASELKGLLVHPLLRRIPDFRAVEDYLGLGYVPDDVSMLAGVKKLPAGHWLMLMRGKPVPPAQRWWDVDFSKRATGRPRDLAEQLLDHLRRAVRMRMVGDVPAGALLSGGVDSSALVALMAETSKAAVRTSTLGLAVDDETLATAALVAERFATAHGSCVLEEDAFGTLDALVEAFDEPFADAAALGSHRLAALARNGSSVVLTGDGADEVLAGYDRYGRLRAGQALRMALPARVRAPLFGGIARIAPGMAALAGEGDPAYAEAVTVTSGPLRHRLYTSAAIHTLAGHRAEQRYVDAMGEAPARTLLDRAQYADLRHGLSGNLLTRRDRTSMAFGLQTREPLLDHEFVAFAATLAPTLRRGLGQGKYLLRKAMRAYLPKPVLDRRQARFTMPVNAWFRGALAADAMRLTKAPILMGTGWFEASAIEAMATEHQAGRADHGRILWQLLMLERSLERLFG